MDCLQVFYYVQLKKSNFEFAFSAASQDAALQQLHEVQFDLEKINKDMYDV